MQIFSYQSGTFKTLIALTYYRSIYLQAQLTSNSSSKYPARFLWWRHQMKTFSALLAICAGNSPVPGDFPTQRPATWTFNVFFDLRLNKRLRNQSWGWWFETLLCLLLRHCNVNLILLIKLLNMLFDIYFVFYTIYNICIYMTVCSCDTLAGTYSYLQLTSVMLHIISNICNQDWF